MKVLFFVTTATSTSIPVELAAKIDEMTNVDVSVASLYDESLQDVDPDVAAMNIEIYPFGASSRFDFGAYRQLRSLLCDFDILHTHHNFIGSIGRIAAAGTGVKVVNTEHNDHQHFSHLQNWVNCPTYSLADMVVANSKSTRNSFRYYERPLLSLTECGMIYNGIDFDRIDACIDQDNHPVLPEGKKVVTASVIDEQKNLMTLVDAMEQVLQPLPETKLVIIGDGPLKSRVEKRAKELSIDGSVTFLGYLPEREQVYSTISKCDIFAVPSLYEGFCNAAVEAMGCGLPLVASDINVLREVVGEGGRFADPHDSDEFADELQALLQNDTGRKELGNTAKDRAREMFPIERTVKEYCRIYQSVMGY
jgi:glycosyltransferase involved in cell wall biosynthesis